ncbi:MAG: hypothetical protein IKY26_06015 [Erysipelotrichaceae bacterium]|nr:hypothetical protein [Erysipelotrichaceae bacterium]
MKKIFVLLLSLLLITTLFGCGAKPSSIIKESFDEFKSLTYEEISSEYGFDLSGIVDDPEFEKLFVELLQDFDYEILDETVDGDTAVVTVKITSNNIGAKLQEGFTNALSMAFTLVFSDLTEDEITEKIAETILEPLNECEKTFVNTVDVKLTKTDDGWDVLEENNRDFYNAFLGGLYDFSDYISKLQ